MALTAQEQAELESLEKEIGHKIPVQKNIQGTSRLTPQEQAELASLEMELGGQQPPRLGQETKQQAPQSSALEAGISSFGTQASMGYLPQIQAVLEPAIQKTAGLFLPKDPEGFNVQEAAPEDYTQRRDRFAQGAQQLSRENPKASLAGGLAGGLASGIATGSALGNVFGLGTRAATLTGRLGQAAATGAVTGAIRNPGETQGEVSPLQLGERAGNVLTDAATGAVFQGGAESVGKIGSILKGLPGTIRETADLSSIKASGAMLKDFRKVLSKNRVGELGKFTRDEGLVAIGDSIGDTATKSAALKSEIGINIGQIYKTGDKLLPNDGGIDFNQVAEDILPRIRAKYTGMHGGEKIIAQMEEEVKYLADTNGKVSLTKAFEIRKSIDDSIPWGATKAEQALQKERIGLRNNINNRIRESLVEIDGKNGTDLASKSIKENRRYTNVADIAKMSQDKFARESSNAAMGLRERISGGTGSVVGGFAGSTVGGPAGAAVGAAAGNILASSITKVSRKYGTPFVAITADKIAKLLEANSKALGVFSDPLIKASQVSPKEFVTSVNMMLKNPEFKKKIESNNFQGAEK